jgi:hypothetical protein
MGALQSVQFKHFDHFRKRLTIVTKGRRIRDVLIPQSGFWFDLERLILEEQAESSDYLLPRQKAIPPKGRSCTASERSRREEAEQGSSRALVPWAGRRRASGQLSGGADWSLGLDC